MKDNNNFYYEKIVISNNINHTIGYKNEQHTTKQTDNPRWYWSGLH